MLCPRCEDFSEHFRKLRVLSKSQSQIRQGTSVAASPVDVPPRLGPRGPAQGDQDQICALVPRPLSQGQQLGNGPWSPGSWQQLRRRLRRLRIA